MYEPRPCRLGFTGSRPSRRASRGAAAIEFALVFLIFFTLFYGIVAFGMVFALEQSLTLAAEEGARAAVQDAPDEAVRRTRALATAADVLNWLPAGVTVDATIADCAANAAKRCITVTTSYDYAGHPLVPELPAFGIAIPATLNATATVQVGY